MADTTIRVNSSDYIIFLEIKARLINSSKKDWHNTDVFAHIVEEVISRMRAEEVVKRLDQIEA